MTSLIDRSIGVHFFFFFSQTPRLDILERKYFSRIMSSSSNGSASVEVKIKKNTTEPLRMNAHRFVCSHLPKFFDVLFAWKNYVMLDFVHIVRNYAVIHVFEYEYRDIRKRKSIYLFSLAMADRSTATMSTLSCNTSST